MSLLNRAWKPGCSLDTSVHSALETFVTMRYINLHLPLPYGSTSTSELSSESKGKGFPYSLPNVGPRADPSVQAVSPQVTISHPPGSRLPLLSARPAITFPAAQHHSPLAGTKLYCLMTETHRCEQLAQDCYSAFAPSRIWTHGLLIASLRSTCCTTVPPLCYQSKLKNCHSWYYTDQYKCQILHD